MSITADRTDQDPTVLVRTVRRIASALVAAADIAPSSLEQLEHVREAYPYSKGALGDDRMPSELRDACESLGIAERVALSVVPAMRRAEGIKWQDAATREANKQLDFKQEAINERAPSLLTQERGRFGEDISGDQFWGSLAQDVARLRANLPVAMQILEHVHQGDAVTFDQARLGNEPDTLGI